MSKQARRGDAGVSANWLNSRSLGLTLQAFSPVVQAAACGVLCAAAELFEAPDLWWTAYNPSLSHRGGGVG